MNTLRNLVCVAAVFSIFVCARASNAQTPANCAAITASDNDAVVQAVRTMYTAYMTGDVNLFHTVAAPDYLAFDSGKRYEGDGLLNSLKKGRDAGSTYVFTVNEPEVHFSCNIAWVTYVNRGSIEKASVKTDMSWLESAILEKQAGRWRIRFFTASRVPAQ